MLQLQIYFNSQQLDLFKDESVVLTQSIQDIKDIQKVFVPFTQTFNVPASKNNNKIFKHFYNFNIDGFDARKKTDSELYLNYKLFKKGKIKLEGVQLKNNEPHTYKLTFFGNTINLKDIVGEDKIAALSHLKDYNFDYNDTNIESLMESGLNIFSTGGTISNAVIIPLITHTDRLIFDSDSAVVNTDTIKNINPTAGTSTDYGVPFKQLKPAIRLFAIIKAIEAQYNLDFSSDFFNTTNEPFFGLYMWLHNKEGELFQDLDAQFLASGFSVTSKDKTMGLGTFFTGFTTSSFETKIDEIRKSRIFDGIPVNKIERALNVKVEPSGSAGYSLVIKKDGEEFQRFDGLTGVTELGQSTSLKRDQFLRIDDGVYTFFIETDAVSSYNLTMTHFVKSLRALGRRKDITFTASAAKTSDNPVTVTQFLPDIKVIDLLTGIFKLFNLTAFEDDNGIIQVKTLDDFYASSTAVHDITPFLDKTSTTVDSVLPFKEIDFKYEGTDSFLANNHKEKFYTEWGANYYNAPEKYDGKVYDIQVPFEHFKYEHLFVTNNLVETASDSGVQYGYSVNESQQAFLGKPLLFYAAKSTATIRALNLTKSAGVSITNPYIPLNCIGTGSTFLSGKQSINFNAEFDEFSREVNPKSLFETYYKTYVEDMFDVRKRITQAKAYLPMSLIYNLNLADKFILNNNEYRINKISTNFESEQSSLELTNIFEAPVFRTLKAIDNNCITVDTTLISTDSLNITVDAACDLDFTIPNTNTGVPTNAVNNPTSLFTDTSLKVTPPTIAEDFVPVSTTTSVFLNHKITDLGKVGQTQKLDEYGFLYSTSSTNLSSTDDIDTLKALGGVTVVPFTPSLAVVKILIDSGIAIKSTFEKTGLTDPATIYYRFYARTNIDPANDKADAISDVISASTVSAPVSQFKNTTGEKLSSYVDFNGNGMLLAHANDLGLAWGGPSGVSGTVIQHPFNMTPEISKGIVEWLTGVSNPTPGTFYDLSHTFKIVGANGSDKSFELSYGNITGAKAAVIVFAGVRQTVQIYGGSPTGNFTQNSGDIVIGEPPFNDLESTSG